MTTQTEAIKLAIEVFGGGDWHDEIVDKDWADKANNAIAVLRKALAEQPAQTCSRHAEAERLADELEKPDDSLR